MWGVLFIKSAGYETVRLNSLHNPNSYWYAFNYEGRNSLFIYLFDARIPPVDSPIPHGMTYMERIAYYVFKMYTFQESATLTR